MVEYLGSRNSKSEENEGRSVRTGGRAELTPFSFNHKDGGEIIKMPPTQSMKDMLDSNSDNHRGYARTMPMFQYKVFFNVYIESEEQFPRMRSGLRRNM